MDGGDGAGTENPVLLLEPCEVAEKWLDALEP
jgi:hypothetical protein